MDEISDTKRLANAVTALVSTITEIMNEKLRVVAEIQEQKIAHKTIEPVFTKKQLAEHFQVSQRTIEVWMQKGYLPFYRFGRNLRFKLSHIEAHWDANYRVSRAGSGRGPNRARTRI